jgi:glucose/arabinose dehydrogenase
MFPSRLFFAAASAAAIFIPVSVDAQSSQVLTGNAAFGDWQTEAPGVRRVFRPQDLPPPFATESVRNRMQLVAEPGDRQPKAAPGFEVKLLAKGLEGPRLIRTAPNGDIFVAESAAGRIRVLRPSEDGGSVEKMEVFASGLKRPFGISFYPDGPEPHYVYVANTDSVVRFPYGMGDLKAAGPAEVVVAKLPTAERGHWTRDVVFSRDGSKMFVSVGSASNVAQDEKPLDPEALKKWIAEKPLGAAWGSEYERAAVLVFDPEGRNRRIYATGIRNCVGMAVHPIVGGALWCSTNERDLLGDDLPNDYITSVKEGGFYGWPWYYIGGNEDPRQKGVRPDFKDKVTVPDILVQPHAASLQMVFYTGEQFPAEYKGQIFAAQHGSWNRQKRLGYKIIRAVMKDGAPTGEVEDFVTGFVVDDTHVWGRPVGVTVGRDGTLLFSEDGHGSVWRVTHSPRRADNKE